MNAPKSWKDVSINQYYDFLDTLDLPLNDEDKALAMLASLSGVSIEYLQNNVGIKDLAKAIRDLNFISEIKGIGQVKPTFKLKGKKFSFDMILKESSASSFISFLELTKSIDISKKSIHNIIAIFCYELNFFGFKKKRTVQSQKEIAEYLKNNMSMNDAFLYRDFFLLSYKQLSKATLIYLDKQNKKMLKTLMKEMNQSS